MAGRELGETYYPSCVVNLRLRFDESMTVAPQVFPSASVNALVGKSSVPPAPLGGPALVSYSSASDASQVAGRIPISAHVELPAYRDAGKFRLTFDYADLPIDPRIVRSVGVSIYMDTVKPSDFATAMGQVAPVANRGMVRSSARLSMLQPTLENCVLQGLADNWQVTHTATGSTVTLEGRDLRGCLLDSPITPTMLANCPLGQDIVQVVQWIISTHPLGNQMTVASIPAAEWPNGKIPSPGAADNAVSIAPRVKRGRDGKFLRTSTTSADPNTLNFWDVITRFCTLVGAVPYFTAEKLVIKPGRALYDQKTAWEAYIAGVPTPFTGGGSRYIGDTAPLVYRRLIFGRNVEEMNVERKMGGKTPHQIEVVSLDTSSTERGPGKLLKAWWPDVKAAPSTGAGAPVANDQRKALVSKVAPSGHSGVEDVTRISVPGITDQKRLQQIAQDLFEEIGRGEMGGNVRTKSLASFGAGNEDPDLIRLRPGDPMQILVALNEVRAGANVSPLNEQERVSAGELVTQLTRKFAGDGNLARAIVATQRNAVTQLQNTYRVSNVVFDWDIKSGVAIAFDFHNFVIVRDGVTPNAAVSGPTTQTTAAGIP